MAFLSIVFNETILHIELLTRDVLTWHPQLDDREMLTVFGVYNTGLRTTVGSVFALIDGTFKAFRRPMIDQREWYSGHYKAHGFKYTAITTPDGLISSLIGPCTGRANDWAMYKESFIPAKMRALNNGYEDKLYMLGDAAYRPSEGIITPFNRLGRPPTREETLCNVVLERERVAVENSFALVHNKWTWDEFRQAYNDAQHAAVQMPCRTSAPDTVLEPQDGTAIARQRKFDYEVGSRYNISAGLASWSFIWGTNDVEWLAKWRRTSVDANRNTSLPSVDELMQSLSSEEGVEHANTIRASSHERALIDPDLTSEPSGFVTDAPAMNDDLKCNSAGAFSNTERQQAHGETRSQLEGCCDRSDDPERMPCKSWAARSPEAPSSRTLTITRLAALIAARHLHSSLPLDFTFLTPDRCLALATSLGRRYVVKVFSDRDPSQEIWAMELVENEVPVPKVIASGMESVDNEPCGRFWGYTITEFVEDAILLADFESEPSDTFYEELAMFVSKIRSHRITQKQLETSNFPLITDAYALSHLTVEEQLRGVPYSNIRRFMSMRLNQETELTSAAKERPLVLSHCDLMPRNLMISPDGNHVACILDWEFCGFYPDFFEFYKYVYELRRDHAPRSLYMDRFLDMFFCDSVDGMEELEKAIRRSVGVD